jgi:uncharacterized membrane protein
VSPSNPTSDAMRYFFHICDGQTVYPDEVGISLSSHEAAIAQARFLAAELTKAGEFHRSSLVCVVDENGRRIFKCEAA